MKKIIKVGTTAYPNNSDVQVWIVNFYSSSAISDSPGCDLIPILSCLALLSEDKLLLSMHDLVPN